MLRGEAPRLLPGIPKAPQALQVPPAAALTLVLTEAAERRASGLRGPLLPAGPGGWPVPEAFHCRLKGPVLVDRKTLVELQGFQAVSGAGGLWGPWGQGAGRQGGPPLTCMQRGWGSSQHSQGSAP